TVPEQYTSYEIGELMVYPDKFEATLAGQSLSFTRKEFELLAYLIKHKGLVLSRDQLLAKVWDYDFTGDTRIVDVHVSRLREKIPKNQYTLKQFMDSRIIWDLPHRFMME